MFMSRTKRKLDYSQEMFIHNFSKKNIGASRAYRLYTGLQGGSDVRGGLVSNFKNSMRNLKSYIGSRDAKFLVVKMLERKQISPTFSFEFKVVQKKLNAFFWADETTKYNYNAFGDVVSPDATFNMNKYDMVFVSFTGIDNHKKCVTFGVGLLSREDGSSYSWLLRAFLKAFKNQPTLVLIDQDPDLNKVISLLSTNPKASPYPFSLGRARVQKSSLAAEHAVAGHFDTTMQLLSRQLGIKNFTLLKSLFLGLHMGSHAFLRAFSSAPLISLAIERGWSESASPNVGAPFALVFNFSQLEEKLKTV
ncbi:unnamed protein product [Lactuca saligna]|uniref:Protein FAR1-RELATED SEQUENCE n=1 Tax=Lactuca saligna TaxID=75948 RepID=A0AA35ZU85_LACSI|nr:unnamed protein product [Lactuca saligna]